MMIWACLRTEGPARNQRSNRIHQEQCDGDGVNSAVPLPTRPPAEQISGDLEHKSQLKQCEMEIEPGRESNRPVQHRGKNYWRVSENH